MVGRIHITLTLTLALLALALSPVGASAFTITSGIEEGQSTNSTSIIIDYFQSSVVTTTCKLDDIATPCSSTTASLTDISEGAHKFEVGGTYNESVCIPMVGCTPVETPAPSAQVTFTVDRTDPVVAITGGPAEGSATTGTNVSFGLTASEGSVTCRLDGTPVACGGGGVNLTGLSLGTHQLVVEAVDAAGNIGAATRTFVLVPPPAITSAPKSVKQGKSISLKLYCPEACKVKGVVKLGSKKLKLKDATAPAGNSTVTFKFNRSLKKVIKSALKNGKKVSASFTLVGGETKTVKIKK